MRDHHVKLDQKEDLLLITEKNSDPNQILIGRVLGEKVYNFIKTQRRSQNPRKPITFEAV